MEKQSFSGALQDLLNMHNEENTSDTPDYVLREYIIDSLAAFNKAVQWREQYYGRDPRPSIHGTELVSKARYAEKIGVHRHTHECVYRCQDCGDIR